MSALALQHVIVRMLYDPRFVERVYADPVAATRGCGLSADESRWLVESDRRAWGVDPLRRARSLTGLLEEFAVTCARLVRALGGDDASARLDRYFSSAGFHHDVQGGSALAPSFGHWLASSEAMMGVDARVILAEHPIEQAIVRARRSYEQASDSMARGTTNLVWARGIDVAICREGALQSYAAALGSLRSHPQGLHDAVLDRNYDLVPPPFEGEETGVLVLGHDGDLRLEAMSAELVTILEACRRPVGFDDLCAHASKMGATREDVVAITQSFEDDGVLRRA